MTSPVSPSPPPAKASVSANSVDALAHQVSQTTNLLKAIVGLLGLLLPSVVVTALIEIPLSLGELVRIITFPASVVAVVAIILLGGAIKRWSTGKAVLVFSTFLLVGTSAAISFYLFAPQHVFQCKGERIVTPMTPSQRVHDIIEPFDNNYCRALKHSPVSQELKDRLSDDSVGTVVLMIVLMVATVLFLVGAMVGILWKAIVGTEAVGEAPSER